MFWADFFNSFFFFYISVLVYVDWWPAILKTGPDRPVQSRANPVRLKPVKNRG